MPDFRFFRTARAPQKPRRHFPGDAAKCRCPCIGSVPIACFFPFCILVLCPVFLRFGAASLFPVFLLFCFVYPLGAMQRENKKSACTLRRRFFALLIPLQIRTWAVCRWGRHSHPAIPQKESPRHRHNGRPNIHISPLFSPLSLPEHPLCRPP